MSYTLRDEPFTLNEKTFMELYDEGMEYFNDEVLPLYTDTIINDPIEGIQLAFGDFLTNNSPLQDEDGEYISWDEALELGKSLYDFSSLDEYTKKYGSGNLKPLRGNLPHKGGNNMNNAFAPIRENLELAVIVWGEDINLGYPWAQTCKEDASARILYAPETPEEKSVKNRMVNEIVREYGSSSLMGLLIRYPLISGNTLSENARNAAVKIFSTAYRKALGVWA